MRRAHPLAVLTVASLVWTAPEIPARQMPHPARPGLARPAPPADALAGHPLAASVDLRRARDPLAALLAGWAAAPEAEAPEAVVIETRDSQKLTGAFYAPRATGRAPAVLLVHDAGGNRNQLEKIAPHLQKRGFAVLALDLRGHGGSASAGCDWSRLEGDEHKRMWAFTLRDVAAAADFLRGRKEVHTSNLSLVGLRAGAAVALRHAVKDENVRAVVLLDPETQQLGFNLADDVGEVGVPTLIISPRGDTNTARRLIEAGHGANPGYEFIQTVILKSDRDRLVDDKRLATEIGTFLREQVVPKRGGR